ncbi:hypothetical protein [Cryobacterium sp. MDB2-33-2]|nr:hypothetical protein [Cryobacterium sp. MDB2-33-2]
MTKQGEANELPAVQVTVADDALVIELAAASVERWAIALDRLARQ